MTVSCKYSNLVWMTLSTGSLLMKACIRVGVEEYNIVEAYLHVPTNESGVIKFFYRCGFKIKKRVENYNVQTDFPDCFLLTKRGQLV